MIVASKMIPAARPMPNCLMSVPGLVDNTKNANIRTSAALVTSLPVRASPSSIALSVERVSSYASRMREVYDETGDTNRAIEVGLERTGKLVTSAALILMFAFLVLSSTPGYEIKSLAIGLAAGIIFDATVIRALLVPATMKLLGDWNWWMPNWTRIALRIPRREPAPKIAPESA